MRYYLCWEKGGSRRWMVRARNADDARRILVKAGEVTRDEVDGIGCAQSSCREYDACGKQVTRLGGG